MISEKQFIFSYNFFWKSLLPTSSLFLRKINENLYDRKYENLESFIIGRRRSFLSYVSFQTFTKALKQEIELGDYPYEKYQHQENIYIQQFSELEDNDPEIKAPLEIKEYYEMMILADRLYRYFTKITKASAMANPSFKGCGFLNNCYGDIIVDQTLYEIKMVNRNFRLQDCKQVLTYCALNSVSRQYLINNVALFNPRSGKLAIFNINDFCLMLSGKSSTFLFGEIIEFISGGGISR